jgi:transaldolase
MKFFIDTAKLDEIREAHSLGLVDGVTTNPSLCAKSGICTKEQFKEHIRTICELVQGPVSAEVVATEADAMVAEARELAKIHEWVAVKIPMTPDGLKATRILAAEDINVNVTLIFQPLQALLAAKAGATYVSPFIGRLDDISHRGMEIVDRLSPFLKITGLIRRSSSPVCATRSTSWRRPWRARISPPCLPG